MTRIGPRKHEWLHGKLFVSWRQYMIRWHVSIGPLDIMWLQRGKRET